MEKLSYEFYVAGVKFHELKHCINEVQQDDILQLVAEPTNKFDSNAVRIEFFSKINDRTFMTGYVPAKFSASITAMITRGIPIECKVIDIVPSNKPWEQLKVKIEEVE